jgi:CheY-like chemotaxis protein
MNAMQALPASAAQESEIAISTATREGRVVIEVSDSGPGIPAQDRERVFEPFVTTKPIGEGTGLGLFVCRNIVRGYGGEVSVQDRPGGGALFRVVLPVAVASLPASAPANPEPANEHEAAHILIIDDDAQVASALSGQLKRAGYRASTCSSGAAGLRRMLAAEDIDLVFCDLMMKGVTGMDVHARLLEQAPALLNKIVFMTGGACSMSARQFLLDHADAVIEKPFNLLAETRRRLVLS